MRRGAGARLAAWCLVGATAVVPGPRPAAAQGTPDRPPGVSISFAEPNAPVGVAYVGDRACAACHQDKAATYHRTAHALTSSVPSPSTVKGSFAEGSNVLWTANPDLYFKMEATGKGLFQTAKLRTSASTVYERTERFDVVIGSGRKGQTYLYWDGDQLLELPVSYWTGLGEWVNSPGYPDGSAHFERPAPPRCLECHASFFESRAPPESRYNPASLVLGIACEKCHGPGGEHVARYSSPSPPRSTSASAIVNPAKLPRQRQIDVCALCHAGIGESLTPPLSFVPGEALDRHLVFPPVGPHDHVDVHASQVQLLERSRCFQSSPAMTCTTCHDVHQPQRDLAALALKCLACHKAESCGLFARCGHLIDRQCIGCHMPLQETAQIISAANGRSLQPQVRNHQIAIYPEVGQP